MENYTEAHGGHRERLRQRLLSGSLESLEPHELIEFLLYYAIPRQDVNELAHALLDHFGSLREVFRAEEGELARVEGMGKHAVQWIQLVGECTRACAALLPEDYGSLVNFEQVFDFARRMCREFPSPCTMQLCLDHNNRLIYRSRICDSPEWGKPDIIRCAIGDVFATGAKNVILVILTGKSVSPPSKSDLQHARDYSYALNLAGSALLDVILAGENEIYSLRHEGQIPDYSPSPLLRSLREDYLRSTAGSDDFPTY